MHGTMELRPGLLARALIWASFIPIPASSLGKCAYFGDEEREAKGLNKGLSEITLGKSSLDEGTGS